MIVVTVVNCSRLWMDQNISCILLTNFLIKTLKLRIMVYTGLTVISGYSFNDFKIFDLKRLFIWGSIYLGKALLFMQIDCLKSEECAKKILQSDYFRTVLQFRPLFVYYRTQDLQFKALARRLKLTILERCFNCAHFSFITGNRTYSVRHWQDSKHIWPKLLQMQSG